MIGDTLEDFLHRFWEAYFAPMDPNNLIWMGFIFLGGATIPIAMFPKWLQRVSLFIPAQYLSTGLQSAAIHRAAPYEVLEDFIALALGDVLGCTEHLGSAF